MQTRGRTRCCRWFFGPSTKEHQSCHRSTSFHLMCPPPHLYPPTPQMSAEMKAEGRQRRTLTVRAQVRGGGGCEYHQYLQYDAAGASHRLQAMIVVFEPSVVACQMSDRAHVCHAGMRTFMGGHCDLSSQRQRIVKVAWTWF